MCYSYNKFFNMELSIKTKCRTTSNMSTNEEEGEERRKQEIRKLTEY